MTHSVIVILFHNFMIFLATASFFLIGLIIGSFLNVVILRGERGEGLGGRSRCMACARTLGILELIPLFSFLWQKGKCKGCKERFSIQYPLVELSTAAAFAAIAWYFLPSLYGENAATSAQVLLYLAVVLLVACACIVVVTSDLRFQIIPDGAVVLLGLSGIVVSLNRGSLAWDSAAAVACSLFFFLLWFVSGGRWMGFGDVKLTLATVLLVGFPAAIAAVLFAFWIGGIVGVILLAGGRKAWGSRIPFGPFILAGALAAWLWADLFFAFTGLHILL